MIAWFLSQSTFCMWIFTAIVICHLAWHPFSMYNAFFYLLYWSLKSIWKHLCYSNIAILCSNVIFSIQVQERHQRSRLGFTHSIIPRKVNHFLQLVQKLTVGLCLQDLLTSTVDHTCLSTTWGPRGCTVCWGTATSCAALTSKQACCFI